MVREFGLRPIGVTQDLLASSGMVGIWAQPDTACFPGCGGGASVGCCGEFACIARIRASVRGFQDPYAFITMIMLDRKDLALDLPWHQAA
jgi:hypothetical protein